jgi:hypothetical protein
VSSGPNDQGALVVVDVADPVHPAIHGTIAIHDRTFGMQIRDARLYLAAGKDGVLIFDIADPSSPVRIGRQATLESAREPALVGTSIAVAMEPGAPMEVLHHSAAASVPRLGGLEFSEETVDLAAGGARAYLASGSAGVRVVSLADPYAPEVVGLYDSPGNAQSLALHGDRLYLADGGGGLRILDVSGAGSPGFLGSAQVGNASAVAVSGRYAYVGLAPNGLQIVDVADPASPILLGAVGDWYVGGVWCFATHVLYSAVNPIDERYAKVVDVSDPHFPGGGREPARGPRGRLRRTGRLPRGRLGADLRFHGSRVPEPDHLVCRSGGCLGGPGRGCAALRLRGSRWRPRL